MRAGFVKKRVFSFNERHKGINDLATLGVGYQPPQPAATPPPCLKIVSSIAHALYIYLLYSCP